MIVYVESNFLLELALGQAEARFVRDLLELAESKAIRLCYPEFALSEPFATVAHRARERERIAGLVSVQLKELSRSVPHQHVVAALQHTPSALSSIGAAEFDLLEQAVARLLAAGGGLLTTSNSFQRALIYQRQYGLQPADAVIYATVVVDLEQQKPDLHKLFVSRNWKDFRDPGIASELHSHRCRFEESFEAAVAATRDHVLGA